jgi:metallo-beta-lactamase family protein
MKLKFLGATGTVTGSCYYIETQSSKFIIDCGMYQGKDVEARNKEAFDFNPRDLDFVILTHSHIDHSGLLPKLYRYGFTGSVYLTPATAAITRILLLDSAKIQEKNNYDENIKVESKLIYDTKDAENAIEHFNSISFMEKIQINDDSNFYFIPAGHILGAASVCLEVENKRFIFSGDLGRLEQSLVKNFFEYQVPEFKPSYIISESLYGNSVHEKRDLATRELLNIIKNTLQRNGNVIIPSFALHRSQELIEILKFAFMTKEISDNVQIFLDSPMAIAVTGVYTQFSEMFNDRYLFENLDVEFAGQKLQDQYKYKYDMENSERLRFDNLRFNRKVKKSLKLLNKNGNIIIAGSGMADGGRILHHLYNGLENSKNSVIFVGYQAEDTMGRQLVTGAKEVLINDKLVKVKAEIHYLRGFSAHADQNDLLSWIGRSNSPDLKKVFLIHSEPEVASEFKVVLESKGYNVEIPEYKNEYIL